MRFWYEWEDMNDPYALGHPDFGVHPAFRLKTKKAAIADFKQYLTDGCFTWKPKMRLFKVGWRLIRSPTRTGAM
jgi:hypothetical protein